MYRYLVDLELCRASMMAAVDQIGSASLDMSRAWSTFAPLSGAAVPPPARTPTGSALGFRNLANYIARSLLEAGGFRPQLHPAL